MSLPQPLIYRARWPLFALACLVELGLVGFWLYLGVQELVFLIYGFALILIQATFLGTALSLRRWPRGMIRHRRPIKKIVVMGGLVAGFVSAGLLYTLLEWPGWWWRIDDVTMHPITFFGIPILGWIVWSIIFYIYWQRQDRYVGLTRITRGLLAGSALETLIAVPTIAFVKDPQNCVCARGSFWGLVFGISAILCLFGPGVVMIFLRQRYIAQRLVPSCYKCEYNLTGCTSNTCPECGEVIPDEVRERIEPVTLPLKGTP